MRHRHVTVTLEAGTVERIEERLEPGETVSAWIADAARERVADDGSDVDERDVEDRPAYEFVDDCAI